MDDESKRQLNQIAVVSFIGSAFAIGLIPLCAGFRISPFSPDPVALLLWIFLPLGLLGLTLSVVFFVISRRR